MTTKYDLLSVRLACLELMGVKISRDESGRQVFEVAADPGVLRSTLNLPDPTKSLDDAIPLIQKYAMNLRFAPVFDPNWHATANDPDAPQPRGHWSTDAAKCGAQADSGPLAVCLAALRCAGRDLKEFEVQND